MAQRVVDAFNRFVDQKVVPRVQPIVEKDMMPDHLIRLGKYCVHPNPMPRQ